MYHRGLGGRGGVATQTFYATRWSLSPSPIARPGVSSLLPVTTYLLLPFHFTPFAPTQRAPTLLFSLP